MADRSDSGTVLCNRCRLEKAPARGVPWGGALGEEIQAKTCADCWAEWENTEVMVINELRLNFMDPKSQEIVVKHLREFLALDAEA